MRDIRRERVGERKQREEEKRRSNRRIIKVLVN